MEKNDGSEPSSATLEKLNYKSWFVLYFCGGFLRAGVTTILLGVASRALTPRKFHSTQATVLFVWFYIQLFLPSCRREFSEVRNFVMV